MTKNQFKVNFYKKKNKFQQWEKLHLRRNLRSDDEIEGDNKCLNSTISHRAIRCEGRCAVFTVIGQRDDKDYLFG